MVFSPEDIAWRSRRSGRYSQVAVFGVLRICCVGQRESCRLASATKAAKCPNPTYGNHHGHAEAVEVVYDPSLLSYRALLELFFQIHDPTRYEQQGSDFGPSYIGLRSFTQTMFRKRVALATISDIEASGRWPCH